VDLIDKLEAKRGNLIKEIDLMRGFVTCVPPNGISRINQEEWYGAV
jgi:hypothetical protein